MVKSLTEAALLDDYARLAQNYDDLLALPEVQKAPQRSSLEHNRRVLQELLEGAELTPQRVTVYGAAIKHQCLGVHLEELGYEPPVPDPLEEEAREIIRESIVPVLYQRADATGRRGAGEIAENLDMGIYPQTPLEMVKLIGLLLNDEESWAEVRGRELLQRVLN